MKFTHGSLGLNASRIINYFVNFKKEIKKKEKNCTNDLGKRKFAAKTVLVVEVPKK